MNFILLQTSSSDPTGGFFDSSWWNFATLMSKAVLVGLWLALVFWTYKDAKRRLTDSMMIGVAVIASLIFPYAGTLFYVILRPPEFLEDVLERDLEIQARELEIGGTAGRCPACRTPVKDDFLICPKCRRQLKTACQSCGKPLDPDWQACPYCRADNNYSLPARHTSKPARGTYASVRKKSARAETTETIETPAAEEPTKKPESGKMPFAEEDELFA